MNDENSVISDGFTVTSSSETKEEIQKSLFEATNDVEEKPEGTGSETGGDREETGREPEEPEIDKKKARFEPNERIRQAARDAKEAKELAASVLREKDEIASRAESYRVELEKLRSTSKATLKPVPSDFQTDADFMEALTDWKMEERTKRDQSEQVARIMEQQKAERYSGFSKRMKDQIEKDPTFMEGVSEYVLNLRPLSSMADDEPKGPLNALAEFILRSDVAPALAKYFSERQDELERLQQMDPFRFGPEIGKIEERLSAGSQTATTPVEMSKAKPPVRPVTGGYPIAEKELSDDASFEDYFKRENAKERKSGSRW